MPLVRCLHLVLLIVASATLQAQSVHRELLPSGLVLVVEEFHQTPTVEVRVAVRAGSLNEGPLLGSGASVLLRRVLINSGAAGQTADEVSGAFARLGDRFYAETTVATTVYGLSTTADQLGDGLALLATLLSNFHYTQADLEREREAMLAQPAPSTAMLGERLLANLLYRQHPARLPVSGTPALLEQVTLDLLRRYQAARYTAANTVITVVGNVNTNEARRQVAQAFARYAVGGFQPTPPCVEPPQFGPRFISGQADLAHPRVTIAWRSEAPEHAAQPALTLLARVLADEVLPAAFASAGVVGETWVELRAPPDQPGALVVGFTTASSSRPDGERAVYAAIESLVQNGPTASALASAKRRVRRAAATRQESARLRAEDLERWELVTGNPGYAAVHSAAIEAVTADQVATVARRYCGEGVAKACTVVLRAEPEPHAESPGKAAEPASSVTPAVIELGRGLRLIAHPPADVPVVHLLLTLGGALAGEEPQLSGSAATLAALLPRGAGPRGAADLAALARSTGLVISSDCDHDALTVSLTCLSDDLDVALGLLADLLTRPILAGAELEALRGELLRRSDSAAADWRGQLLATCRAVALAGDASARPIHGPREVVARLDRSAIEALWQRLAVGGNAVLSIAGRYDRAAVEATLATLLAVRPVLPTGILVLPAPGPAATIAPLSVIYHDGPDAGVAVAWKAPAHGEAADDVAPLAVLAALLAGIEVPGGRINRALALLPDAPTLSAITATHARRGLWIVHGAVAPEALDTVSQVVREQVAHLLAQLELPESDAQALTPIELATAKQMCLTAHAVGQEDVRAVAARAASALLAGVDPGVEVSYPRRIAAVTVADLQRVARLWLANEPVIVVSKPRAPAEGAH